MKIFKYLSLAILALATASCEKHEIEYPNDPIPANCAMVQIHYMVPQKATNYNKVHRIDLDGVTYVNNYAALMATYGSYPGSSIYYSVKEGSVDLKLYVGFWEDRLPENAPDGKEEFYTDDYDKMVMIYSGKVNGLKAGTKYQVIVHDLNADPLVIDSDFSFSKDVATEGNMTENTAEHHFKNFYNLLYEDEGVPYQGTLQYQYRYVMDWEVYAAYDKLTDEEKETAWDGYSEWLNVGDPVAFGESTGWVKLPVVKKTFNDAAYATTYNRIIIPGEFDEEGEPVQLQIINSKGTSYANFSDYWTSYVGRHDHHFLHGFRSNINSRAAVTQWCAY